MIRAVKACNFCFDGHSVFEVLHDRLGCIREQGLWLAETLAYAATVRPTKLCFTESHEILCLLFAYDTKAQDYVPPRWQIDSGVEAACFSLGNFFIHAPGRVPCHAPSTLLSPYLHPELVASQKQTYASSRAR